MKLESVTPIFTTLYFDVQAVQQVRLLDKAIELHTGEGTRKISISFKDTYTIDGMMMLLEHLKKRYEE